MMLIIACFCIFTRIFLVDAFENFNCIYEDWTQCASDNQKSKWIEYAKDWEFIKQKGDISLYKRVLPSSGVIQVKAERIIHAPLEVVEQIIRDIPAYPQLMYNCLEGREIKQFTDEDIVILNVTKMPWPLQPRDVVVRTDVVWSYAFGASFAAAAYHKLKNESRPFTTKYFVFTLLFLSILFAPSGIYLLWEHTQWETMQVATSKDDLPSWLVTLFAVTNITQGILGYFVSYKLIKAKKIFGAHCNWIAAWIIFWFILVCGWDCTGWQRFLYDVSVNNGQLWTPGTHMGISFFYASRVWWTLVIMGLFFAPMLINGYISFIREGAKVELSMDGKNLPSPIKIITIIFGTQWIICLLVAIIASLIVMELHSLTNNLLIAYPVGIIVSGFLIYYLILRRNMICYKLLKAINCVQ